MCTLYPASVTFLVVTTPLSFPSPARDYAERPLDLNEKYIVRPHATFFMRAEGSHLSDAGILDGSLLIVDRSLTPKRQDILVVIISGDLKLCRLADLDPEEDTEVWGVVAHVITSLRQPPPDREGAV